MIKAVIILNFIFILFLNSAHALEYINKINVKGNQRVSTQSILDTIRISKDSPYNNAAIAGAIKNIWNTGFFDDVKVFGVKNSKGGIDLIFKVTERPAINSVQIIGYKHVDKEDIDKAILVKRFSIMDRKAILKTIDNLKKTYQEKGYYLADITYKLTPRSENLVDLTIKIDEGEEQKVKEITFSGNRRINADEVKRFLQTKEVGYFSFLTDSGKFDESAFTQDLQIIREYYLTKGFVNVQVGDPVVKLSPDKKYIFINIPITEGEQFKVGKVGIEGDLIKQVKGIKKTLKLKQGDIFNSMNIRDDTMRLNKIYQDQGYAFANISNSHKVDFDKRIVDFTYIAQKGKKYTINRIVITGNEKTEDKVVRRELMISEGELFSLSKVKASKARIMRLGFFKSADISTRKSDIPGYVDLIVHIEEKDTGSFQVGMGFSSLESLVFTAQISKYNFLGRGQTMSLQVVYSGLRSILNMSFFDPYMFDSNWTFSLNLYNYIQDFDDFTKKSLGGSIGFGYRFTHDLILSFYYKLENVTTEIGGWRGRSTVPLSRFFNDGLTSSVESVLSYDTRNNMLFPTNGQYTTLSAEYASKYILSHNSFARFIFRSRWYYPLIWKFVFKFNATFGYIMPLSEKGIPIFERFFVGGIFTVRGFQRNSLGPYINVAKVFNPDSTLTKFTIGGNKEMIFNFEIEFPIFAQVGIRGVVFFDAGNAYNENENISFTNLRTSVGFGIRWWSPIGPLRFEWGIPLKPKPGEDPIVFEFTIGNAF